MRRNLFRTLAVIAVVVGLLFTITMIGCKSDGTPKTETATEPKIFKFAEASFDSEVFDPILHSSVTAYQYLVYESLVGSDITTIKNDTRSGLAYKWDASPDNTVWTFYLRKDAKWSDGVPVTAQDVKFSIPRIWQENSRVGQPDLIKNLLGGKNANAEIDTRMQIIDDYTIRFTLTGPQFRFADLMSTHGSFPSIAPKHVADTQGEAALAKGTVASGAYVIKEHVSGSLVRLAKVPNHAYLQANYDQIDYLAVGEEATRLAMMKTGAVDASEFAYDRIPELETANFSIIKKPTGTLWSILFTEPWRDPVLANKEVRQAIMMAINHEEFNKAFFYGAGLYYNDGGNIAQLTDPTGKILRKPIAYNLAKAKEIVARKVPQNYTLNVFGCVRDAVKQEHIESIASYLTQAGFKVNLKVQDYKTLSSAWIDAKLGSGVYLKDGRLNAYYLPSIYGCSPEAAGRNSVIQVPLTGNQQVNPAIPMEDLLSIKSMDDLILGPILKAKNWDEYYTAYEQLMDRAIDQVAPGSGFLYTPRVFAVSKAAMPKWGDQINLGYSNHISLENFAIVPPEFEDSRYHPKEYEEPKK